MGINMELTFEILMFITGLIIGSFLNVCIYRIPKGESIAYPPSHCTSCGNRIKPYDLIPVVSWIFLKGRCRYCGEKIYVRYTRIELLTGILFVFIYLKYGFTMECLKFLILASFLIVIGMIDFDTTDVYAKTTWTGIIIGGIFLLIKVYMNLPVKTFIYGAFLGGGLISLIIVITKGMGWGDAEICLLGGLFLGLKLTVLMMGISFVLGGVIGVILILTGKKNRKDYIPFGPFIAVAVVFTSLFGSSIIKLYISFFM
jgi:leader peptidase (prepilin peptidase)/N-methyltransferase